MGRVSWLVTRRLAPHGPTRWPAHHCEVASQGQAAALWRPPAWAKLPECSHLSACEQGKEGAAGWGPQGQEARGGAVHPPPLQGGGHPGKTEQCPCGQY